jgi:WG containing repeat
LNDFIFLPPDLFIPFYLINFHEQFYQMKILVLSVTACLAFLYSISQSPRILVPYRVGNKWGYSDTLGKIKIQPKYDTVSLFDYDMVFKGNHVITLVKLKGKPMAINEMGAVIVPPKYDHININWSLDEPTFFIKRNDKWGVFTKGKELFEPVYDYMDDYSYEGFYQVHSKDKWGLINSDGKIVIPVIYDQIRKMDNKQPGYTNWDGIMWGKEPVSYTIKRANVVRLSGSGPAELMDLPGFMSSEDLGEVNDSVKIEYGLDSVRMKNYTGIVYKGAMQGLFLPTEVKKVYFFSKQYSIHHIKYFSVDERNSWNKNSIAYIIASLNGKYGMMNEAEREVLPFAYDSIEERDGFFLLKRNGKVGFFIWNTVHPVIQPAWDGYIWKVYIPVNSQWNFTLFRVEKNGKQGFVGENGIAYFKD